MFLADPTFHSRSHFSQTLLLLTSDVDKGIQHKNVIKKNVFFLTPKQHSHLMIRPLSIHGLCGFKFHDWRRCNLSAFEVLLGVYQTTTILDYITRRSMLGPVMQIECIQERGLWNKEESRKLRKKDCNKAQAHMIWILGLA